MQKNYFIGAGGWVFSFDVVAWINIFILLNQIKLAFFGHYANFVEEINSIVV